MSLTKARVLAADEGRMCRLAGLRVSRRNQRCWSVGSGLPNNQPTWEVSRCHQ
jgi:hypothetical protein